MRRSVLTACFFAFVVAATTAGCGGAGSPTHPLASSHTDAASAQTPAAQPASAKHALAAKYDLSAKKLPATTKKLHATVYNPSAIRKSSRNKASGGTDIPLHSAASRQNPCTLVTASQASALLRAEVQRETEAPLGPTCVLKVKGQKQFITFAVEEVNVAAQIRKMKQKPSQLTIDGHPAYCGRLGAPLLYLKLTRGRALEVTAPCAAARTLAAKAVPHIRT